MIEEEQHNGCSLQILSHGGQ